MPPSRVSSNRGHPLQGHALDGPQEFQAGGTGCLLDWTGWVGRSWAEGKGPSNGTVYGLENLANLTAHILFLSQANSTFNERIL